jgi:hypothetical protein
MSKTTTTVAGAQRTQLPPPSSSEIWTINELIKRRASELKDSPLLAYPRSGLIDYEEYSALKIDRLVDAAVAILQQRGLKEVVSTTEVLPRD